MGGIYLDLATLVYAYDYLAYAQNLFDVMRGS